MVICMVCKLDVPEYCFNIFEPLDKTNPESADKTNPSHPPIIDIITLFGEWSKKYLHHERHICQHCVVIIRHLLLFMDVLQKSITKEDVMRSNYVPKMFNVFKENLLDLKYEDINSFRNLPSDEESLEDYLDSNWEDGLNLLEPMGSVCLSPASREIAEIERKKKRRKKGRGKPLTHRKSHRSLSTRSFESRPQSTISHTSRKTTKSDVSRKRQSCRGPTPKEQPLTTRSRSRMSKGEVDLKINKPYFFNCIIDVCLRKCKDFEQLQDHFRIDHNLALEDEDKENYDEQLKTYYEEECKKYYPKLPKWYEESPYVCIEKRCCKIYINFEDLIEHKIHCHNLVALFRCSECKKCFPTKSDLNTHVNLKHEERIYCFFCLQSVRSTDMHIHLKEHRKKCFWCNYCDLCFISYSELADHIALHTAEERSNIAKRNYVFHKYNLKDPKENSENGKYDLFINIRKQTKTDYVNRDKEFEIGLLETDLPERDISNENIDWSNNRTVDIPAVVNTDVAESVEVSENMEMASIEAHEQVNIDHNCETINAKPIQPEGTKDVCKINQLSLLEEIHAQNMIVDIDYKEQGPVNVSSEYAYSDISSATETKENIDIEHEQPEIKVVEREVSEIIQFNNLETEVVVIDSSCIEVEEVVFDNNMQTEYEFSVRDNNHQMLENEIVEHKSPALEENQSPNVIENNSPDAFDRIAQDVLEHQSSNVFESKSQDVIEHQSSNVFESKSLHVMENYSPDVFESKSLEEMENKSSNEFENASPGIVVNESPPVEVTQIEPLQEVIAFAVTDTDNDNLAPSTNPKADKDYINLYSDKKLKSEAYIKMISSPTIESMLDNPKLISTRKSKRILSKQQNPDPEFDDRNDTSDSPKRKKRKLNYDPGDRTAEKNDSNNTDVMPSVSKTESTAMDLKNEATTSKKTLSHIEFIVQLDNRLFANLKKKNG